MTHAEFARGHCMQSSAAEWRSGPDRERAGNLRGMDVGQGYKGE